MEENKFILQLRKKFELSNFLTELLVNQGFDYVFSAKVLKDLSIIEEIEQQVRDNPHEYVHLKSYFRGDPKNFKLKIGHKYVLEAIGKMAELESKKFVQDPVQADTYEEEMAPITKEEPVLEIVYDFANETAYQADEKVDDECSVFSPEPLESSPTDETQRSTSNRRTRLVSRHGLESRLRGALKRMLNSKPFNVPEKMIEQLEIRFTSDASTNAEVKCPGCLTFIKLHSRFDDRGNFRQYILENFRKHLKRKHGNFDFATNIVATDELGEEEDLEDTHEESDEKIILEETEECSLISVDLDEMKRRLLKQIGRLVGEVNLDFFHPEVYVRQYDSKLLGRMICPSCQITITIHARFINEKFSQWLMNGWMRHLKRIHQGRIPHVAGMIGFVDVQQTTLTELDEHAERLINTLTEMHGEEIVASLNPVVSYNLDSKPVANIDCPLCGAKITINSRRRATTFTHWLVQPWIKHFEKNHENQILAADNEHEEVGAIDISC